MNFIVDFISGNRLLKSCIVQKMLNTYLSPGLEKKNGKNRNLFLGIVFCSRIVPASLKECYSSVMAFFEISIQNGKCLAHEFGTKKLRLM